MTDTTWNPSDKNANITLSDENLTATSTNIAHKSVRATKSHDSDKLYFEIYINNAASSAYMYCGIGNSLATLSNSLGTDVNGWSFAGDGYKRHGGAYSYVGPTFTTGDIIGIAVDLDSGKMWASKNNTWVGSGDPSTGANPLYTDTDITTSAIFPMASIYPNGGVLSLRTTSSDVTYSPPDGFIVWDFVAGYFDGYVYDRGYPVVRTIRCYNREDGSYIGETTSSGAGGYYYLTTTYSGAHYLVCLDDVGGVDYNDLIIGNVYPTTISG